MAKPRCSFCRAFGFSLRLAIVRAYLRQNVGVNSTSIEKISRRPSSIASEQTQVWKSVRPW